MPEESEQSKSQPSWGRRALGRVYDVFGKSNEYLLIVVAMAIGAATGAGACGFYWLIEKAAELAYGHEFGGGVYGGRFWLLALIPAAGGLAVGCITHFFAREAKGHGVPEVMDAIARKDGRVRPRVAVAKSIASALTIGTGGSAGTEGPIIQIGAAIGSSAGQWMRAQRSQMPVLVACGAAAGISSIFNAPIAGVLFALEIFLRDLSIRTFAPVVLASVLSSSITHSIRGADSPIFAVPPRGDYYFTGFELPFYLVLGLICALGAVSFIWLLYKLEDYFDALKIPEVFKPAIGALGVGIIGVAYVLATGTEGMPQFFSNGYPFIEKALRNDIEAALPLICILWVLKWIATSLTLGSGGSGGVFAPSLFLGAAVGAVLGLVLQRFGLIADKSVTAYALVGMAAMVAGTTHAPLTAIVILIEMTRDYKVILPIMFAAIIATSGARLMMRDSIYTLKLRRRGIRIGSLADMTILRRIAVWQIPQARASTVQQNDPLEAVLDLAGDSEVPDFVVTSDDGTYEGMVLGDDVTTALLQPEAVPLLVVHELLRSDVPVVTENETLDAVLNKFARTSASCLPIILDADNKRVTGVLTRSAVMQRYHTELERLRDEV